MSDGPFPQPLPEFNAYVDVVTPYLNTNSARLDISAANLTALNTYYDNAGAVLNDAGWKQLWPMYSNPDTVNKTVRDLIKIRRLQMEMALRKVYNNIGEDDLTVSDRNTLNLPLRDSNPTPIQSVNFPPVISFDDVTNNIQILRFQNPTTPDSNALPDGQKIELQTFVGAAGIPDNNIVFVGLADTGKHLYKVIFLPAQKGQTAYYRARYKTETGKVGPWSDVASEIIL